MKTMTLVACVASLLALSGCTNTSQLDQMSNQIDRLSNQVSKLSREVDNLKSRQQQQNRKINEATKLAKDTNERVNNMVATFKK